MVEVILHQAIAVVRRAQLPRERYGALAKSHRQSLGIGRGETPGRHFSTIRENGHAVRRQRWRQWRRYSFGHFEHHERTRIKEGHRPGIEDPFIAQWHQKLHSNTTPDDIKICEAYLHFLHTGNWDDFWTHLWENAKLTRRFSRNESRLENRRYFRPSLSLTAHD